MRDVKGSGGSLLALVVSVTAMVVALTSPFADATYTPAKSTITLTGIGSAPACPAGWTEIVAQTAAGTFAPVTSLTTTNIAPITSISTFNSRRVDAVSDVLCTMRYVDTNGDAPGAGTSCDAGATQALASGGSATTYTVANGGSATTYTYYYRVCEK